MKTGLRQLVIVGDIGGHLGSLIAQLESVGVNVTARDIPRNLVVVQVGDLVHRGLDSAGVVRLVDQLMKANPNRWVQLVGNHESQYLPLGTHFWSPEVDSDTQQILRRWWETGQMKVAAAFELQPSPTEPIAAIAIDTELLVTHAGLTIGAWDVIDRPVNADDAATQLNEAAQKLGVVWRSGLLITGEADIAAGPMWADGIEEVYAPWQAAAAAEGEIPAFAQTHGHTSPFVWARHGWNADIAPLIQGGAQVSVDEERKICRIRLNGGQLFWAVDPRSAATANPVSRPLTLTCC